MERGHEIKVLDHGYVRLIDYMGSDATIVEAARMSTGRGFVSWKPYVRCKACGKTGSTIGCSHCFAPPEDCEKFPRGDLGILDYLYRNRHTTPFEMAEVILEVKVPMDHWRQWIRHRTASVNEYSTRYSPAIDEVAATAPDAWRTQGMTNRQGSGTYLPAGAGSPVFRTDLSLASDGALVDFSRQEAPGSYLSRRESQLHDFARDVYQERLDLGVAKEQARKDLPLSTYTVARWKCDLHNTLHFLGLRMHTHAQHEIRLYANAVAEIVKSLFPHTYSLFEEYTLGGVHLSRSEVETLRRVFANATTLDDKEIALRQKIGE